MKLEQLTEALEKQYSTIKEKNRSECTYEFKDSEVQIRAVMVRENLPPMAITGMHICEGPRWKDTIQVTVVPPDEKIETFVAQYFSKRKEGQSWNEPPPYLFINNVRA
jgi:hypothetical protein